MKAKDFKDKTFRGYPIVEIVRKDDKVIIMYKGGYKIFDKEEEIKC